MPLTYGLLGGCLKSVVLQNYYGRLIYFQFKKLESKLKEIEVFFSSSLSVYVDVCQVLTLFLIFIHFHQCFFISILILNCYLILFLFWISSTPLSILRLIQSLYLYIFLLSCIHLVLYVYVYVFYMYIHYILHILALHVHEFVLEPLVFRVQ